MKLFLQKIIFTFLYLVMFSNLSCQSKDIATISDNSLLFKGKRILITGGTGYIGRALTKEILKYDPKEVLIVSRDEVKHYTFSKIFNDSRIKNIIADVRDYQAMLNVTQDIDILIHAAALKRVDIIEDNIDESIKTNIIGPLNIYNACKANKVKKVVFVSTDKACSPINAYGGCKFVSEKLFTNHKSNNKNETIFTAVRYGNVLDSTGSIIPILMEKIKNGEEISLTDPMMTRFIINRKKAMETIFDAIRYGQGGEIFVRKLNSVKIDDLIDTILKKFNANNKVKITGIRPGEKIHEILINESEALRSYEFGNYYIIVPTNQNNNELNENKLPLYIKNGKKSNLKKNYSSKDNIITKQEFEKMLNKPRAYLRFMSILRD